MLEPERLRDVLELSVDTTGLRFVSFEAPYDYLAVHASHAVAKGNELAIALPAVGFIVDATLDLLERPEFAKLLSQEVAERAEVAIRGAEDVASYSVRSRLLRDFYLRSEHLQPFLTLGSIHNFMSIADERYIGSQGGAPFREASTVAGGALRLLRASPEIGEDPTDILVRSVGLLPIANIPKPDADNDEGIIREQKERNQYLGFPYVKEGHLTVRHNPTEIRLTSKARSYTKQLARASESPYSGCPARKVVSAQDPHKTVLEEYWAKIVRFLVPPGATVTARR